MVMSNELKTIVIDVEVKVKSPIHLSSGRGDVVIDSEIAHDEYGMPVFSARRFKGLLYESAQKIVEMAELLENKSFADRETLEKLFHHESDSDFQLSVYDFHAVAPNDWQIFSNEWKYLQEKYPEIINPQAVLNEFTSIRYQTSMENGLAKEGSLHNMRVVDSGNSFYGRIHMNNVTEKAITLIVLALRNLRGAGLKRNRGFGEIECIVNLSDGRNAEDIIKVALS